MVIYLFTDSQGLRGHASHAADESSPSDISKGVTIASFGMIDSHSRISLKWAYKKNKKGFELARRFLGVKTSGGEEELVPLVSQSRARSW